MTNNTLLSQVGSKLGLDRRKKGILIMFFALFSAFLSQSQFVINTQPPKIQRICFPNSALSGRLQVAAVTCSGYNLTYQWQRNRPTIIGGTGTFIDLANPTAGYTGVNTPTLDIVNDSLNNIGSRYLYRCFITSSGSGGSCPSFETKLTNVSEVIGVRKPIVKYLTPRDTSVCEAYSGNDTKYPIRAAITNLSRKDTLIFSWQEVDKPSFTDVPIPGHGGNTGVISTWTQSADTTTLIKYITLNTANNTPMVLSRDQSNYYLKITSYACGVSDTATEPKRRLTVHPVPNVVVNTTNINICEGVAFNMTYTVSNAERDAYRTPTPINWSIASITGSAALTALFTTTTGTGNGPKTISVSSAGSATLSVGVHTITLNTITNTTDAPTCGRGLTSITLTVNVYPKPVVNFIFPSAGDTTICQGSSGIIKFQVSNATFNGTDVSWTVTATDPSGLLAPATLTGKGNQIVINTIPNSLGSGAHTATLTNIVTSGVPSICTGTIGALPTITVKVIPSPNATMNTTITEEKCVGSTATNFDVIVSNAVYPVGAVNLNWKIFFVDSNTNVFGAGLKTTTSPGSFTGTGNGTFSYTTSGTLAQGTHTIRLVSIELVSPSGALVHPVCSKLLYGQTKIIRVNPNPSATLSSASGFACEGTTPSSFDLVVSGASYPPALSWTITTTGTFHAAATGSAAVASTALTAVLPSSGTGNGSFTFQPPSNLAPGRYVFNVTNIALVNTPSCFNVLALTYTLDIFPKPSVILLGSNMLDSLCEGGTSNFLYTVFNAQYSPLGVDRAWSLNFTDATGSTIPAAPITGSGNTTSATYTTSSALTTGTYSLTLLQITNTTNSCANSLPGTEATSTRLTRRIYPKPKAALSTAAITVCEGTASSFTVVITNAVKQPGNVNMPWTLSSSGTFEAAPAGSPSVASTAINFGAAASGTGNNAGISISVPNTLAAGKYIFTIANPILNVSPLNCTGTTGISQITIVVNPKPTLAISPNTTSFSDSTCQGVGKSFTVTIGNAYYSPAPGPMNIAWAAPYTNTTGGVLGASGTLTGSGNSATTYNTNSALAPGNYEFKITALNNTTNTCNYSTAGSYKLTVLTRPTLTINTFPSEVCFFKGAVVNYTVSNVAAGRSWSFTYTAANTTAGGPVTVSGVGSGTFSFTTPRFNVAGAGTISFTPIGLVNGCASTATASTINLSVAGLPTVSAHTIIGTSAICGNALPGNVQKVTFRVTVANMIVGAVTKNWKITYNITGTQDTINGTTGKYNKTALTVTGTGNGSFDFNTPNQTYNGNAAFNNNDPSELGVNDARTITITKIETTGSGLACDSSIINTPTSNFTVMPRPRFQFTSVPTSVCQGSIITAGYNVDGFKNGESGSLTWVGVNPNSGANNQSLSGPSTISQSIVTGQTVNLGNATITVSNVINSTTGCVILTPPTNYVATIKIDTPSTAGKLITNGAFTTGATVCEGNGTVIMTLTNTVIGTVRFWEFSEDDGYTWKKYANTTKTHTVVNPTLTRRWRVVVKNLTCDTARSNDVIIFVHPQPKVQIASYTSGICVGDTVKFTLNVTGVPTNHTWKFTYTKAGFAAGNGNATLTGKGSGTFSYAFTGWTGSASTATIQLKVITNDSTNCANDYSASSAHLMTIIVGSNSTAGAIELTSPFASSLPASVCKGSSVKVKYVGSGNVSWWYASNSKSGTFPAGWDSTFSPSNTFTYGVVDTTTRFRVRVKFGTCSSVVSAEYKVNVLLLPTASITGSDTICENSSITFGVVLKGEPNSTVKLTWLEGSTNKNGNFALGANPPSTTSPNTISTGALTVTTNVILQSVEYTSTPTCQQLLYTNAIATATVNPKPKVTINSVTTPVCQGSTSSVSYTISGVGSSTAWLLTYKVGSSTLTTTGTGAGTFNLTTPSLSTAGNTDVEMVSIASTNLKRNCTSGTLSGVKLTIVVDATTVAGTLAADVTVCKGGNASVSLNAGTNTGGITRWNVSTTGATGTYSGYTSTTSPFNLTNVITKTWVTATFKNGICPESTSTTPIAISVQEIPVATITNGSVTVCSGSTGTLNLSLTNVNAGQRAFITYLEGATTKTKNFFGTAGGTITTSALTSNTDVTLVSLVTNDTLGFKGCSNTALTSTATVNVNPNPSASLNSVSSPVCASSTANSSFSYTISGVSTGTGWTLTYNDGASDKTVSNVSSGTFTTALTLPTSGNITITLKTITTTSLTPNCTTTLSGQTAVVVVDATTIAGTVKQTADSVVCIGANGGTASYAGGNGSVVRWEVSSDNGASWSTINRTTSTLTWSNLSVTTMYRVIVKSGSCAEANSAPTTIVVRPLPTATISGSKTVCQGDSAQMTITVVNRFGNPWSITLLEGTTTRTITTPTFFTKALNGKTDLTLQNIVLTHTPTPSNPGGCFNTISSTATIDVVPMPNATLNFVGSPVCHNGMSTINFTVSNVATGQAWKLNYTEASINKSTTGSGPGTYTINTGTLSAGSNVVTLTSIEVTSTSPNCTRTLTGQTATITVDATTVAGSISTPPIVCKGTNSGTLTYTPSVGGVVRWEFSITGGSTWSATGTTSNSYRFSNLTQTTMYRVIAKNGSCNEEISSSVTLVVRDLPTATLTNSNTVCQYSKAVLTVTVTNTFGNPWVITYLEGTTSRTKTGTGNGTDTLSTMTLSGKTDVTLQSIMLTHTPAFNNPGDCANGLTSTATVDVINLPNATINAVSTPICVGSTSTIQFTVDNIASGQGWLLNYTEAGIAKTTTNSGPGTFTISTAALNTAGANVVTLDKITITSSSPNCPRNITGQSMTITVDATTVAVTLNNPSNPTKLVCRGSNSGTLTTTAGTGAIVRWEAKSGSGTYATVATSGTTYNYSNLTQTTTYRVINKNSACLEAISNEITVVVQDVPVATITNSPFATTICSGTTGQATINITNVSAGQRSTVSYLEGSTTKSATIFGTTGTITTSALTVNTDINLISVMSADTTLGGVYSRGCSNSTLTSKITINVAPLPFATINSVQTPVCQASSVNSSFTYTISSVSTGQGWSLSYALSGATTVSTTVTGTGSGTFTTQLTLPSSGTVNVALTSISTTGSTPNCTQSLSSSLNITVDATTVAVTLNNPSDPTKLVCRGSNSGTLTTTAGTGAIVRWEAKSGSGTYGTVSTSGTTYSYSNLTQTTTFRVINKNSMCLEATSNEITVVVQDIPVATISGSTTICSGTTTSPTIAITNVSAGQRSRITYLEGTTTKTATLFGTSGTIMTSTLTATTDISLNSVETFDTTIGGVFFRGCSNSSLSSTATIRIIQLPTATLNSVKSSVCQGSISSFQYTIANVGTGQGWSLSYTEEGNTKTATGSGPGTYSVNTGVLNTAGKVAITFVSVTVTGTTPNCTRSLSATDTIIVDATTVAGTISGAATVCKGSNSGTLTYSGGNGKIVRWEYSINNGTSWSSTGTTANTFSYSNLTQNTDYRVIVRNSACLEAISAAITITVREQPFATISGSTTICQNTSIGLSVTVSNSFGNPWSITYLDGTTTLAFTGSGDGVKTLTTLTLTTTSDITLQSILLTHSGTSTNPACGPNTLTSSATVKVTPLPTSTLVSVVSPICQGNTSTIQYTVSNIATGLGWTMEYTEGSSTKTVTGNGPGTYSINTATLSAGTVTITLKKISTTGLTTNCERTLTGQTMDITVNATTTVGNLSADITVCKNDNNASLSYNVGASNGSVVRWESSVISSSGPWTSISNTTNTQKYINISQTTFYRVVVKNGTCAELESNVITVSVQEIPVATISGSGAICAGTTSSLNVSITNVAAGQRSILTYLEGTTSKTINLFGTSGTITTSVLNTNTDVTLVSVQSIDTTISATFRKGCSNTALTSTATVNVNALPNVTLVSVGGPICQGNSTTYSINVSNVPTGQGWNMDTKVGTTTISPLPSGTGGGSYTFNTPVLNTPPSADVEITKITNTTTGCSRTIAETRTITVNATTTVGTTATNATVCKGNNSGAVNYSAGGTNGAIIRWEYSTVSPSANFIGITNTANDNTYSNLTATTYYRAIVKNGACNEAASTVTTITVRELPNATISGNATICEGTSTNFTISVSNTFGQTTRIYYLIGSKMDSITVSSDGTNVVSTGVLTVTTNITLLSIKQISGTPQCNQNLTGTITITVNELPRASFTSVPTRLCQGSRISFTFDVSQVKSTRGWSLTFNIKAPSSASQTTETTTGSGSGTYSFTTSATVLPNTSSIALGTITNTVTGCTNALNETKIIDVDATTVGGTLTTGTNTTVCKGSNSGTLTLGGNTGSVVRWEFSTDNRASWSNITSTSLTYAYSNLTQTTIFRAVVMNGVCNSANSSELTITVRDLPMATIGNATICAGNTAPLQVVVSNTFGESWTITFVEGSATRTLSGTGNGTFTLTTGVLNTSTTVILQSIVLTTGTVTCSNTLTGVGTVTVNALPSVSHDTAPTTVCDGSSVDFNVNVDNVLTGQNWTITYKVGTGSNQTRSGTGPGVFTITSPVFTNATTAMRVDNIDLISIVNNTTGCPRTETITRTIEVYPKSNGGTTSATVTPLCANSATTSDITVTGFVGRVTRWEFSEDNGATWSTLSNTASTITVSNLSKTRVYRAVVTSGPCSSANSATTTITIIATVDAQIIGAPQVCAGKTALFNVLVSNIGVNENWSLTYRVNGTIQTAMTGKGPGNYPLTVGPPTTNAAGTVVVKLETITNTTFNCANITLNSQAFATVNPNPIANFTFVNACKDSVVVFNNTSTIASGSIADFTWNFGDGTISKDGNPTHAYPTVGSYNVSLLAISSAGCRDSIAKAVIVNPRPVANFTFSNTCQDIAAVFTDASTVGSGSTIKSYFWNFGDGSFSSVMSPTHKYAEAGTYTVKLTVVSTFGCASIIEKNITVYNLPEPNYVAIPVCQNAPMNFVNTSSIGAGTMTYKWDFAGQGSSTLANPTHTFTGFGSFNVTLTATSNNGCVKTLVKPVTVWANPIADFTVGAVCIGETSRFINTGRMPAGSTDVIIENFWNFGDSTFSTGRDPWHLYARDGIYSVSARATSDKGCVNIVTKNAVVHPLPKVVITASRSAFCEGQSATLTANAPGIRPDEWTLNGVSVGNTQTITVTSQGWYKVKVYAPGTLGGCSNVDSIFITVWPLPIANAGKDTSIDKGQSVILRGDGAGLGGSYQWSPTTYLTPSNGASRIEVSKPDVTQMYILTVTDRNGCKDDDSITITVKDQCILGVYNVVTPNGDLKNDTWIIENIEAYPEAEVGIINRYGMKIFSTTGYKNEWDGTYKAPGGDNLPEGAYYYIVDVKKCDKIYTGALNLIRGETK